MKIIAYALVLAAIVVLGGNVWLAACRARTGRGPSPMPVLATILGVSAVALLKHAYWIVPAIFVLAAVDFGSWILAGTVMRRRQ